MQGSAQIHVLRKNALACQPRRKKAVRNQTQLKVPSHSSKGSHTNSSHTIEIQTSVLDVVTSHMHKDSTAQQRNTNANTAVKLDTSPNCAFQKNAQPQSQQCHKDKPKQTHQIIIPEQSNERYKSADKSDDDDDFIIAYQTCAQPQKNVNIHSQKASTSYTKKHLSANIPYRLQSYHKHNKYLCVQPDTWADVNLMPENVYKLVFNDPHTCKLAKNDIDLTVYTRHSVDLISKCIFFMLSKDTK